MTTFFDALRFHLSDIGVPVFIGYLPSEPDTCVVIYGYPGPMKPENTLEPYNTPHFQICVRGNAEYAATLQEMIFSRLHALGGIELSGIWVVEIRALQSGYTDIGRDEQNRTRLTQNYMCEYYQETQNRL